MLASSFTNYRPLTCYEYIRWVTKGQERFPHNQPLTNTLVDCISTPFLRTLGIDAEHESEPNPLR
jgi:hypothetical protein